MHSHLQRTTKYWVLDLDFERYSINDFYAASPISDRGIDKSVLTLPRAEDKCIIFDRDMLAFRGHGRFASQINTSNTEEANVNAYTFKLITSRKKNSPLKLITLPKELRVALDAFKAPGPFYDIEQSTYDQIFYEWWGIRNFSGVSDH